MQLDDGLKMTIETGKKIPDATLLKRLEDKSHERISVTQRLAGRRVALLGMPGAFTGTCSGEHIPGLIARAPEILTKVDEIIVFVVNDPQVVKAWGESSGAFDAGITILADPFSELTEGLGLRFDNPDAGLIGRCTRFAAIVQDGTVETLLFEDGYVGCAMTGADGILDALA